MYCSYNGIVFDDIRTLAFDQQAIRTEDETQTLTDHYTIRIQALLNRDLNPSIGQGPADTYADFLMGCLNAPRKQLIFAEDFASPGSSPPPINLIVSPAVGFLTDANNGPRSKVLSLKKVSPSTWVIEFEIETWIACECTASNAPILTNRWTETQQIDSEQSSIITRRGELIFRADMLAKLSGTLANLGSDDPNIGAARQRIIAQCPLRPRCLRTSEYTFSSDWLKCQYTITDKEVYAVPLRPLTRFEAEYSCITRHSAVRHEEMFIKCWGNNKTSKGLMYATAAKILLSRISTLQNGQPAKVIKDAHFKEKLDQNYLELHVSTIPRAFGDTFLGMQVDAQGINRADPPNGTGSASDAFDKLPDPGAAGTWAKTLVCAALDDPCLNATVLKPKVVANQSDTSIDAQQSQPAVVTVSQNLLTSSTYYQTQDLGTAYITSLVEIDYRQDENKLMLPTTGSTASFATLAQPTMKKVVSYTLERYGDQPQLPKTVSADPNEVLLNFRIVPQAEGVEADGLTPTWRISGRYEYGLKQPTTNLYAGTQPFLTFQFSDTLLKPENFVDGLTSPSTGEVSGYFTQLQT